MKDLTAPLRALHSRRQALAEKERRLIADLSRVLPKVGYRAVRAGTKAALGRSGAGARKTLACPKCSRRFAHRLHLGRHLSATHGIKKRAGR
jgi:uncharacterized C2H2 Zn-finger protein